MSEANPRLLDVRHLKIYFRGAGGALLKAVDDVSFSVERGKTLGIVGESGCGKSVACMSILKLVPSPPCVYAGGEALFDGQFDTLALDKARMQALRGARISMIFQEPMAALNPVYTVKEQMQEAIRLHLPYGRAEATALALDLLSQVRVPDPERVLGSYPFMLSGGMRQRVMIAMALSSRPDLLIADEPTTALDVTIQSQIVKLIKKLRDETGMGVIFITHDLSLISEIADDILVMYAGKVCEFAPTHEIVHNPLHPYTQGLIESRPSGRITGGRLPVIPGGVPSLASKPAGCPFHTRCPYAMPRCRELFPPEVHFPGGHVTACWRYAEEGTVAQ